eukprot:CFRG4350T1
MSRYFTGMMTTVRDFRAVIVRDGVPASTGVTPDDFLTSSPTGAYTVGRTVDGNTVFEFDMQIQRMATSIYLMNKNRHEQIMNEPWHTTAMAEATNIMSLRSHVMNVLKNGLDYWKSTTCTNVPELKIILVIPFPLLPASESDGSTKLPFLMTAYICPLSDIPKPPIKVHARVKARHNPNAKNSDWIRERKALTDKTPKDINEILLLSQEGYISEGMSSNFFCIHNGELVTADGADVLAGTVRDFVLKVCKHINIPIRFTCPNINEAHDWTGAFITSTSRLVLPIDTLYYPNQSDPTTDNVINYTDDGIIERIRREVEVHIRDTCVKIE